MIISINSDNNNSNNSTDKSYKEDYKNIEPATVELVKHFIEVEKPWSGSGEEKMAKFVTLLNKLSQIYSVTVPVLEIGDPMHAHGSGCYLPLENKIILPKFSLVTLLHEFKHHLQHCKGKRNTEEAARGWSISLFYQASQKAYERAVKKGILLYK